MSYEEVTVSTVVELVWTVLSLGEQAPAGRPLWFRGHRNSAYELAPGLVRGALNEDAMFDRERRLLTRFRQRSLPYWPSGYPQSDWEHMFAMQHHGVPTRLLDWSENLFVAVYFAVSDSAGGEADPSMMPALWCLDPIGWNRGVPHLKDYGDEISVLTTADDELDSYKPESHRDRLRKRQKTPVAVYGTHNSQRIVAQRGTFTVAGRDLAPLESFAGEISSDSPVLWKILLNLDPAQARSELAILGFTETMIFPDLAGLARELDASEGWPA